jgi:hypothetical protein
MLQCPNPACMENLMTQTKNLIFNQDFKPRPCSYKALDTHPRVLPPKSNPPNPINPFQQNQPQIQKTMALAAFISTLWSSVSASPVSSKRRRRIVTYIDPDSIEPINHWFPGNRNKKQPRRLVETPTAEHWPEYRVAKKVVAKGRKRCGECGALVKEEDKPTAGGRGAKARGTKKKGSERKGKKEEGSEVGRRLRGRVVEYAG